MHVGCLPVTAVIFFIFYYTFCLSLYILLQVHVGAAHDHGHPRRRPHQAILCAHQGPPGPCGGVFDSNTTDDDGGGGAGGGAGGGSGSGGGRKPECGGSGV